MKKKIRRPRLDRETLRNLTPENLAAVAGGYDPYDTYYNSCDLAAASIPNSLCNSCRIC